MNIIEHSSSFVHFDMNKYLYRGVSSHFFKRRGLGCFPRANAKLRHRRTISCVSTPFGACYVAEKCAAGIVIKKAPCPFVIPERGVGTLTLQPPSPSFAHK